MLSSINADVEGAVPVTPEQIRNGYGYRMAFPFVVLVSIVCLYPLFPFWGTRALDTYSLTFTKPPAFGIAMDGCLVSWFHDDGRSGRSFALSVKLSYPLL